MAELVFFRRFEELMRVSLDGRSLTVGRGPTNDILVPDPAVSRQQFVLERSGEAWRLRDLSGKGTEVGGTPVADFPLIDGSDIGLGQWRAVFTVEGRENAGNETTQVGDDQRETLVQPGTDADARILPARLRLRAGEAESFVTVQQELTIGSAEGCEVKLEDGFVSARHARIERRGNSFLVTDLQSKNGTFVGAMRVHAVELPFGCPFRIGNAELALVRADREEQGTTFEGMVGSDAAMRKLYETIERVADSSAAVSIFGESGTGKERVARAFHNRSGRASRPFVPVNCGAISKELVESELFGHEKGAFTGAERLRKGAFEEADGGTLFLDEIGELPLELQAKLLRALELGEIKRVGASRPVNVDARIVAATNRDLRAEVKKGTFREDLYWRLCVIPLQLPPLRARRGDVRALVQHFLKLFSPQANTIALSGEAEAKLLNHDWPGNVRELKNAVHRSLLLRTGEVVEAADVTFDRDLLADGRAAEAEVAAADPLADDPNQIWIVDKQLEAICDEVFVKTVRRIGSSATTLARTLGQSRGAVYRRMEKLGIVPASGEGRDEE